jgi:hypothetical protein
LAEVFLDRDEHNQTGILTSASNLTPAFPNFRSVALGVCSRYSGATVPDSHRVPRHLTVIGGGNFTAVSKSASILRQIKSIIKGKIKKLLTNFPKIKASLNSTCPIAILLRAIRCSSAAQNQQLGCRKFIGNHFAPHGSTDYGMAIANFLATVRRRNRTHGCLGTGDS